VGQPIAVARAALAMSLAFGGVLDFEGVASRADRFCIEAREPVGLVARLARDAPRMGRRLDEGNLSVAVRAWKGHRPRLLGMGDVAADAGAFLAVGDLHSRVAAHARGSRIGGCVGCVAARAVVVRPRACRGERGLLAVAADAGLLATRREIVGAVAADARIMTRGVQPRRLRMAR
jgi:hypothetical protein